MTIFIVILVSAVWILGWTAAVPGALQRRMLDEVRMECPGTPNCIKRYHPTLCPTVRGQRGALRARNASDVWAASYHALFWPVYVARALLGRLATFVISHVGLTQPELDRRQRELERKLADLDKLIIEQSDKMITDAGAIHTAAWYPNGISHYLAAREKR